MAVVPASKAYFRGGPPRREYVKGAPLFACTAVKFNGVSYARGDALPIANMTPHKHWEMWLAKKADHVSPVKRAAAVLADAEAAKVETAKTPADGWHDLAANPTAAKAPLATFIKSPDEAAELPPPPPSKRKR